MPEILEVELTRRSLAPLVGRRLGRVVRTDQLVVAEGVDSAVPDATVEQVDRRGKTLVLRTDRIDVAVHLGMTGKLILGQLDALGPLAYGSRSVAERWDRWVVELDGGEVLRLHDPRRLGRVWLEPDIDRLGPDALTLTKRQLELALAERRGPLKAVLLDQHRVAGLGNLLVDEVLWRAGLDPRRSAGGLDPQELARLHRTIRARLPAMGRRGGSHTGTIDPAQRAALGPCPRCGGELVRGKVGGRTTVWCPSHQR